MSVNNKKEGAFERSDERIEGRPNVPPVLLSALKSPLELHSMSLDDLTRLAAEIRTILCDLSEKRSCHLASNLGVVELAIALHSVFDFRRDRLVWDVGHQCYPHKLLTGRFNNFETLRTRGGLSGYPNPLESDYDLFMTGHAGCSVGSVLGLACGDSLVQQISQSGAANVLFPDDVASSDSIARHSIAVVGDGAFSSGPIFEALNHAGGLQQKMLVILNDNKMSICQRVGGLGRYLDHMRMTPRYLGLKNRVRRMVENIPSAYSFLSRFKDALKAGLVGGALFEDFGFQYIGPIDGHDLRTLRKYLEAYKTSTRQVLLHVLTEKGRGYPPAEHDPSRFHSTSPAKILGDKDSAPEQTESKRFSGNKRPTEVSRKLSSVVGAGRTKVSSADRVFTDDPATVSVVKPFQGEAAFTYWAQAAIYKALRDNPKVCVIVAAMTQGNMLEQARADFPDRFFDVGICEAHAVNFAAGLAKSGMRPIVDIYSGFLQRAYDHLFQEISLQNLPVVFALDRAGLVGADGPTHHGVFDLSYLRPFPNMSIIAPGDAADMEAAFAFALQNCTPTAIRYPKAKTGAISRNYTPFELGKAEVLREGTDGVFAVCGGGLLKTALGVADALALGNVPGLEKFSVGVVNARFVKPLDVGVILQPLREGKPLVTVEENMLSGGFGAAVLEAANDEGLDVRTLTRLGVPDLYIEHGSREEELSDIGLDFNGLVSAFVKANERARALKRS